MLVDFQSFTVWLNLAIFGVAAIVIWQAGVRLSRFADVIGHRTGLGQAFVGLVILAFATSLPELSTSATAAVIGRPMLATSNLLGGIVLQTTILAIADIVASRSALTSLATRSVVLVQASLLIVLLGMTMAGAVTGELFSIFGVGIWSTALVVTYLLAVYFQHLQQRQDSWTPANRTEEPADEDSVRRERSHEYARRSTWTVVGFFVIGSLAILLAGTILARVADALAVQSGLGTSFIGATLLAASTSLPEISTTIGAVRIGANRMAISNIFGSNMMMVAFLFMADAFYRDGTILDVVGQSEQFVLTMGIVVTAVYLIGLIERRDRTMLRLGYDSLAVLILYAATLVGLFLIN